MKAWTRRTATPVSGLHSREETKAIRDTRTNWTRRIVAVVCIIVFLLIVGSRINNYWSHRFDSMIERQAAIYRVDPDLVWSIIYEETYFSPWKTGADGEIGLMQVTPTVGREWATETGMRELVRQMETDPQGLLRDPERNIQIGCWYLEKIYKQFQDVPDAETRMVAGYNAGPSRAAEWSRVAEGAAPLSGNEFVGRIDIPSTKAYVISIMERYRRIKNAKR